MATARRVGKTNKNKDQQTKDAKTIKMLKDTVNRMKQEKHDASVKAKVKDEEISRN